MRYIGTADYHAVGLCARQFISWFQKKKGYTSVKYHKEISVTEIRRFCAGQDAEGILFIDYLDRGKTITGEYYSSLLTRLAVYEIVWRNMVDTDRAEWQFNAVPKRNDFHVA